MEKQKRIALNAEKRKVIADVFQNHFEDNFICIFLIYTIDIHCQ